MKKMKNRQGEETLEKEGRKSKRHTAEAVQYLQQPKLLTLPCLLALPVLFD
jgi:hypothetical protein